MLTGMFVLQGNLVEIKSRSATLMALPESENLSGGEASSDILQQRSEGEL